MLELRRSILGHRSEYMCTLSLTQRVISGVLQVPMHLHIGLGILRNHQMPSLFQVQASQSVRPSYVLCLLPEKLAGLQDSPVSACVGDGLKYSRNVTRHQDKMTLIHMYTDYYFTLIYKNI